MQKKNPHAQALGRRSWERNKAKRDREFFKKLSKLGVAARKKKGA